jgi:hypothetical protein
VFAVVGDPTAFPVSVQNASGQPYAWTTRDFHSTNISDGDQDLTGAAVDSTVLNHQAAWLWGDAFMAWSCVRNAGANPGPSTIKWERLRETLGPCTTACFVPIASPNAVFIPHSVARSPDTVVHEIGHEYRYNVLGGWWFVSVPEYLACLQHDLFTVMPSPQCAFSEGFSDYFALAVNSQLHYQDWCFDRTDVGPCQAPPNGVDLAHQWWTDGRPKGELVEGRVAGALWDLTDQFPDGFDNQQDSFSFAWAALGGTTSTPRDFYLRWAGKPAGCVFYNNTIDYAGCNVRRVYLPILVR